MSKRSEPTELLRDDTAVLFCSTGPTPSFCRSAASAQTNVGDEANVMSEVEGVSTLWCDEGLVFSLRAESVSSSVESRVVSGFTGSLGLFVGFAIEFASWTDIGRRLRPLLRWLFKGVEL